MTENHARKQLRNMLRSLSGGSVLQLLGDVFGDLAEKAERRNEVQIAEQLRCVKSTLLVVGLGVDSWVMPHDRTPRNDKAAASCSTPKQLRRHLLYIYSDV